jgi:D-alanyl-lipoteichoic acid acyltransferase DltB (MBOAT superfamily)
MKYRKWFVLFVSYIFYIFFDWRFAALLFFLTWATYFIGLVIAKNGHAKLCAWVSVLIHLAVLGGFKYINFFLSSAGILLSICGMNILLISISFYTFQAISYATEIYRKKIEPVNDWVDYAIYLSFSSKLIAGHLFRPKKFLEQLDSPKKQINKETLKAAILLLLLGVVKKVIIADSLAGRGDVASRAASLASVREQFPSSISIQGFFLYAYQIYADFSGYSDIALASAAMLGYKLPQNFKQPYLSSKINDFWNRWYISLPHWFREYLFFPLIRRLLIATKKNYSKIVQTVVNLITMTLTDSGMVQPGHMSIGVYIV